MFTNQSDIDLKNHERMLQHSDRKPSTKIDRGRKIPKLVQIQFAQFLNHLLEYSSELTYFAINAFQTSSLRRVQINTLQRFTGFCVPRTCAFYYNLDTEFDNFVQKMRILCALAKRTFLDIRLARIHYSDGRMMSLPITRRSIEIFKCNINRLRDLKQIHKDIGYDLLLPNDQLYLALDLLITDFELLNCELDAEVKFADAMILQTIIKGLLEDFRDIFLQYRIALTWIYSAVKQAAYRPGDPNIQQEIKKCDQPIGIPSMNDYCSKQKKLVRHSSLIHSQSFERGISPTGNMNQNAVIDTRKKRKKDSTKMLRITAAKEDFTRYLSEKKLQDVGMMNLKKYIPTSFEFNQFIENMRQNMSNKNQR